MASLQDLQAALDKLSPLVDQAVSELQTQDTAALVASVDALAAKLDGQLNPVPADVSVS